jgi:DNA-binding transcriptional LysR family regulator
VLDVRRLRVLREVALMGSLSAAAESLSFTPSAVSQQVATLERETGVVLLERDGRGVRLTDAARALVGRTEIVLAELNRAEADIKAVKEASLGSLSIGAFPTSGTWLIPATLRAFAQKHPNVEIRLSELEPEASLPMLQRGEIDVALAFECDFVPLPRGRFEEETLFREPMLIVHASRRYGRRHRLNLNKLRDEPWIVPSSGTAIHEFTLRACQIAGFQPKVRSIWTDFQVVQSLAAQGYGVAFVPQLALSPARAGVVVRHAVGDPHRRVFAAWQAGSSRAPLLRAIVDAFRVTVASSKESGNELG